MQTVNIAVITRDTILAVGLKHLIRNMFGIKATIIPSVADNLPTEYANTDLFITDSEGFATNPEFFIPRRNRTIVIAATCNCNDSKGMLLDRHADETTIISRLTEAIDQVCDTLGTGNELSQREIDVLAQVASGYTNKEIADNLSISVNTVLTHRKNITAKLGIKSVSGLSVYAMMNGYISSVPDSTKSNI